MLMIFFVYSTAAARTSRSFLVLYVFQLMMFLPRRVYHVTRDENKFACSVLLTPAPTVFNELFNNTTQTVPVAILWLIFQRTASIILDKMLILPQQRTLNIHTKMDWTNKIVNYFWNSRIPHGMKEFLKRFVGSSGNVNSVFCISKIGTKTNMV